MGEVFAEKIEIEFDVKNVFVINNLVPLDFDNIELGSNVSGSHFVKILNFGFLIEAKGIYDILKIADKLEKISLA